MMIVPRVVAAEPSFVPRFLLTTDAAKTDANPLGKRLGIFTGGAKPTIAEVVGVVGDVHMNSLGGDYTLAMYAPYRVMASPMTRVVLRTAGDPAAIVPAVRAVLARRDRGLVLNEVRTVEQILASSLEGFSLRGGAVVLFGAATLLLAMLGVYGVLAFTVNMRRQDIALRIVVGASRRHVLAWVMTRGLTPVGVGLVLGLAGAFCFLPACDATRVSVVTALRRE